MYDVMAVDATGLTLHHPAGNYHDIGLYDIVSNAPNSSNEVRE
jgi:hypothetical protein